MSIEYAHPSYSTFYDTTESSRLPYNEGNDATSSTETSCFLAPNVKFNYASEQTASLEKTSKLAFIAKALKLSTDSTASKQQLQTDEFLDFKKILLPSMLMAVNAIAKNGSHNSQDYTDGELYDSLKALERNQAAAFKNDKSRSALFKLAMDLLPSDSQWYRFNQLRLHGGRPERSDDGIEKLIKYYSYLNTIEKRFPFETKQVETQFVWKDSFNGSITVSECIHFEKAAVLFNLGSIYAQLGASQRLWTVNGKKFASAYFQKSATVFGYIRDTLQQRIKQKIAHSSDLSEVTLSILMDLMLAQATECVYEKANDVSSPVTSMIAAQTADYYEITQRHVLNDPNKNKFPQEWVAQMKVKSLMYTAIAHFHAPLALPVDKNVSERVARLKLAEKSICESFKLATPIGGSLLESVKGHQMIIANALAMANHANFEKHNQLEVDSRLLAPLKRPSRSVLCPPTIATLFGDFNRFPDMFNSVVTPNHSDEIAKFINDCSGILGNGKSSLNTSLLEIDSCLSFAGESSDSPELASSDYSGNLLSRGNAILQQLHVYHQEEQLISSEKIITTLKELFENAERNVKTSLKTATDIDESTLLPDKLDTLTQIRVETAELTERMLSSHGKYTQLESSYKEDVLKFSPSGWSDEKIKALLPNVFDQSVEDRCSFKEAALIRQEKNMVVTKLKDLQDESAANMSELGKLESTADLLVSDQNIDFSRSLAIKVENLKRLSDFIASTKISVAYLKTKLISLFDQIDTSNALLAEHRNACQIVDSFEQSLKHYINYREHGLIELGMAVRLNQECEALLNKVIALTTSPSDPKSTNTSTQSFKSFENFSTPQLFKRATATKISQIIPEFSRNSNALLKSLSKDSKVCETFAMLVDNDIMENSGPRHTENLRESVFEREKFANQQKLLRIEREEQRAMMMKKSEEDVFDASELENAPLDTFLDLNSPSGREEEKKSSIEHVDGESVIPAHEKLRRNLMRFVGMKDKAGASRPPAQPRMQSRVISEGDSRGTSGFSIGSELPGAFTRRPRTNQADGKQSDTNDLRSKMRNMKVTQTNSEVLDFMKSQNTRITLLQDRIDLLESRKGRGGKRSVSASVNASVEESESDILGWVQEQVTRARVMPAVSRKPSGVASVVGQGRVDSVRMIVKELKEDVMRMDSGIASRGTSSEDVIPAHSARRKKSSYAYKGIIDQIYSYYQDGSSLKDTLAQMKRDNDLIAKQIGQERKV